MKANKPNIRRAIDGSAPPYVAEVWDAGPLVADRYTVVFGDEAASWVGTGPGTGYWVTMYLAFSVDPTDSLGFSQWGEVRVLDLIPSREGSDGWGRRILWSDLPPALQEHVDVRYSLEV